MGDWPGTGLTGVPGSERDTSQVLRDRARMAIPQLRAVGTASENGAISASKAEPPAVTIW